MKLFHQTPLWVKKLYPDFVWQKDTSDKVMYLTFDDGPIPDVTDFVLDLLKKYNARATFFCVGDNICKHPQIATRVHNEGHRLANHTYNHLKGWSTPTDDYLENVALCEQAIGLYQQNNLFRPPYGRIKRAQASELKDYQIIMWNRLSWDFAAKLDRKRAIRYLQDSPAGSIFVFHDNVKAFENMSVILPEVLNYYTDQGFIFKTL